MGDPVTAIDQEGHPLTYTLREASTVFALDPDNRTTQRGRRRGPWITRPRTSYTVVIEASDGLDITWAGDDHTVDTEVTVTITVIDVDEPPAQPDAPLVAPSAVAPTTALHVTWTAPANDGRPAITDYDVQYRQVGASAWIAHSFVGVGTTTRIPGLEPATDYEVQVAASNDEGTSPWSDAGVGRTRGLNTPPVIDPPEDGGGKLVRAIAENSPAGTSVGAPITATDADGDTLTYALSGASAFVIDAASGQIRVAGKAPCWTTRPRRRTRSRSA